MEVSKISPTLQENSVLAERRKAHGRYNVRRYNMVLPEPVYEELKEIADKNGVTMVELFRKFIKLGLIAHDAENNENTELILRKKGETDKTLILV